MPNLECGYLHEPSLMQKSTMTSLATSPRSQLSPVPPWLPLALLPTAAALVATRWQPWMMMWALAFAVYAGLKWLSFASDVAATNWTLGRKLGYLLLWPGMDPTAFHPSTDHADRPGLLEWAFALLKVALGISLVVAAVATLDSHPRLAGWIGMIGIVFMLHFGLFHLLSAIWRRMGIPAAPLMYAPILAHSLSDFWSRRWNLAFRDLAHRFVFRPSVGRLGIPGATIAVFLVSGIVHDAVISIPAGGGFGLPTLYFLIQAAGVLLERGLWGKREGICRAGIKRLFCAIVVIGPLGLLFHRPFLERVVQPMLVAIGSCWS